MRLSKYISSISLLGAYQIKTALMSAASLAMMLVAAGCAKEDLTEGNIIPATKGEETWITLKFGTERNTEVSTKATVSVQNESQVYNFYLFVFDSEGAKITGTYYDSSNLKSSRAEVSSATEKCWYVSNASSDTDITEGVVRLRTASGNERRIYMIANLDSDMVRVSSDLLSSNIHNEQDLLDFNVYLNQSIINRNGYFPMTGRIANQSITASGGGEDNPVTIFEETLALRRIDAKIKFIFKTGNRPDENGQTITKFEAQQWKVVNVPRTAYLLGYEARGVDGMTGHDFDNVDPRVPVSEYSEYAKDFFDTDFVNFEEYTADGNAEFSFYMLENRQTPKKTPTAYQDRSRSKKLPDGTNGKTTVSYVLNGVPYEREMRLYEYANDFSTYVVVTGRVEMNLKNDSAGQVLGGDVQYIIHLGDWNASIDNSDGNKGEGNDSYSSLNDFNTIRNTAYTYTVTVNSVHNIRVEVETSKGSVSDVVEKQPGASGSITIAKEEIMLCDSHYCNKTIDFHLNSFFTGGRYDRDHCVANELTWSVQTPFGEGEPLHTSDGMDITTGLDYKWVHFRLNKRDSDGNYSDKRRKFTNRKFSVMNEYQSETDNAEGDGTPGLAGFHNDGVMDITEVVQYIKRQIERYLDSPEASEFDNLDNPEQSKLRFTLFVDEYYYESNPLNDEKSPDLWKRFVNQEDRKLHILCNSEKSKDFESMATGSVITVQQHAIKSIYNTSLNYTSLMSAWGVENTDEYDGQVSYWKTTENENRGNTSESNGLLNTAKEWGLCNRYTTSFNTGNKWDTYFDYEVDNATPQLRDDYTYLRYSCMARNRDNNGDGIIDRNEMRWYMASIRQLIGLYVGDGLLSSTTKLYNKTAEEKNSTDRWMQHVVSSYASQNNQNSNDPTIVWAEEGISTGVLNANGQTIQKATTRCVRNLGFIDGNSDETYSLDKEPEDYIQQSTTEDGNYIFTNTHLNSQALRYYTSRELTFADENSIENRLYKKFEVLKELSALTNENGSPTGYLFTDFNDRITKSIAEGKGNPFCPEGYRIPSQRELAIIRYYLGNEGTQATLSRTYWSFGPLGKYYDTRKIDNRSKYGFIINNPNITVYYTPTRQTRCVRDIRTD